MSLLNRLDHSERLLFVGVLQAIMYVLLWSWNTYVASYISVILIGIIFIILCIARIADWIEPSGIPGWYYLLMIISICIPLIIGVFFYFIYGGQLPWMQQLT